MATTSRTYCRFTQRFSTVSSPPSITSPSHLNRPSLTLRKNYNSRLVRCLAAAPGPPDSGPPLRRNPISLSRLARAVARIQGRVQVFFAVLFWMSLFFYASASNGRGKGKRKKGSRFK